MAILGPFDFRGGFSPGSGYMGLPEGAGYATDMRNCRSIDGEIRLRWGTDAVNASALGNGSSQYVNGITTWKDVANSKTTLVATCGAKIYIADATSYFPGSSTLTFTDETGTATVSATNSLRYTFDSLNGILVGSGNAAGSGPPFKVTAYNSAAANLGGSPPSGDCVKQVNNFLFIARNLSSTTTQSTVYWSNVNDPETWTGTNVLNFNKNDGEPIMALGSIGTDLYIFKQRSIGRLSTVTLTTSGAVTLGPLTTVVRGIGCCGPLALDNLPNGNIVFVGYDGHFYEFDGSTPVDISRQPYPGYDAYGTREDYSLIGGIQEGITNTQVVVKVCGGINEVYIAYDSTTPSQSQNVWAYDFENRKWNGQITSMSAKCMTTLQVAGLFNAIESTGIPIHGNGIGGIFARGDQIICYPTTDAGAALTFSVGTTIRMPSGFEPKSIIFETSKTNNIGGTYASLSNLNVGMAFDTFCPATIPSPIYTAPSSLLPAVVVIPLQKYAVSTVSGDSGRPRFLSLVWQGTGTGGSGSTTPGEIFRLGKFYVSDEVIV